MELALSLEKLVNEKLLALHQVAVDNNDPEMSDFVEREYLQEQVEAIKKISGYVSQLRRVGKGHGVNSLENRAQILDVTIYTSVVSGDGAESFLF